MAQPGLTKTLFALVFGVAVWGWVLGLTGAALRFLSDYSAMRRYIADASYWIYLVASAGGRGVPGVGGPLAAALGREISVHPGRELRGAVPELPLPGAPDVHRPVAQWPQISSQAGADRLRARSPRPHRRPDTGNDGPVAQLRGITKKFGAVTALNSIDIEVRRGELLAVLGPNGAGKSHGDLAVAGPHRAGRRRRDAARRCIRRTSCNAAGSA